MVETIVLYVIDGLMVIGTLGCAVMVFLAAWLD
jgi:hypothetical protein